METVKLIIDRRSVEVPKGTTILDAAKGMGIRYSDSLLHEVGGFAL